MNLHFFLVKKSKTPAQDRLENLIVTNKTVAENLAKLIDSKSTTSNDKREKPIIHATKRSHTVTKRTTDRVESAKSNKQAIESDDSMVSVSLQYTKQHNAKEVEKTASDEIPALFPSKNLAEQRMTSLQQKLTNGAKKQNVDALCVFRETFGMGDSVQSSNSNADMDDAMDWESSDDAAYSFQQLESMVVEEELTDSFYIVPDTNVFLDSLTAIKNISEQGIYNTHFMNFVNFTRKSFFFTDHKCSILIPFVVLQELDQLKRRRDESPVGLKSSCAIRYIYKQLKAKNPRMHGKIIHIKFYRVNKERKLFIWQTSKQTHEISHKICNCLF